MKYLCLAYGDQKKMEALSKSEFEALVAKCRVHDEELRKSGHLVSAESLEWGVTSIRKKNGKVVVTDDPFVASREVVGGVIVMARHLTEAIARAFLTGAPTVAQRIVRFKARLREADIRLAMPPPGELAARLDAVLRVVYLVFHEGHSASSGADLTQQELSREAIRLGRLFVELLPEPRRWASWR